jgi:predicted Rossmann fold flavoprotein
MCAIEAGKRGRRVLVIESNAQVGRKILISGGGRCNFTNLYSSPEQYISGNPNFARSAMARYTPADFIALIESHGIAYHEKKLGQLFCDGSARQVVDMLVSDCVEASVEIGTGCSIQYVALDASFTLTTNQGDFGCESLVIASGGLSIPRLGATDFSLRMARQFDIPVIETRPGLVPLRYAGGDLDFCGSLTGVSIDCIVTASDQSFRENLLFTHRGVSGPSVLQASSYWREGEDISIDILPNEDGNEVLTAAIHGGISLTRLLETRHPRRFAQAWTQRYGPIEGPLNSLSKDQLDALSHNLQAWRLTPTGTEGYDKAEVTVGGIDTTALSSGTMECREVAGLYFVGEAVDVTGWLGGYNFQWAWASGFAAGQVV